MSCQKSSSYRTYEEKRSPESLDEDEIQNADASLTEGNDSTQVIIGTGRAWDQFPKTWGWRGWHVGHSTSQVYQVRSTKSVVAKQPFWTMRLIFWHCGLLREAFVELGRHLWRLERYCLSLITLWCAKFSWYQKRYTFLPSFLWEFVCSKKKVCSYRYQDIISTRLSSVNLLTSLEAASWDSVLYLPTPTSHLLSVAWICRTGSLGACAPRLWNTLHRRSAWPHLTSCLYVKTFIWGALGAEG